MAVELVLVLVLMLEVALMPLLLLLLQLAGGFTPCVWHNACSIIIQFCSVMRATGRGLLTVPPKQLLVYDS